MQDATWKTPFTLATLKARCENTLASHVGIEFIEKGNDFIIGSMPIDNRTKQTIGIMHGGASCVLAETIGSLAANYAVDLTINYCVGLSITTQHIRSVKEGSVIAKATPDHLGKSTQVWHILIRNQQDQLISKTSLTMAVLKRSS